MAIRFHRSCLLRHWLMLDISGRGSILAAQIALRLGGGALVIYESNYFARCDRYRGWTGWFHRSNLARPLRASRAAARAGKVSTRTCGGIVAAVLLHSFGRPRRRR